jgi:threonyl-tRNA synthetase
MKGAFPAYSPKGSCRMSSRLSDVASRRTILPAGASVVDTLTAANVLLNGPTGVIAVQTDDGVERDLTWVPDAETEVALIQRDSPAGLAIIRHSTTHIMAQAVQNLFPSTRLAIGPPTAEGFYYDFLSDRNFTPDDLWRWRKRCAGSSPTGSFSDAGC